MQDETSGQGTCGIASITFPFLGSFKDGELFEYLLLSLDAEIVEIALLEWFINRAKLHIDDEVELHLPTLPNTEHQVKKNIPGVVIAAKHSEELRGDIYQIAFSNAESGQEINSHGLDQFPSQEQSSESLIMVLVGLIKDSMLLKSGIRVYFKHLIPYFSRISNYSSRDYMQLAKYFLHDIEMHIIANVDKLEKLYQLIQQKLVELVEVPVYVDLEELRAVMESEVSLPLFNAVFSRGNRTGGKEQCDIHGEDGIMAMYLNAIKSLEKRLYSNYNNIVMIYLKSLS